MLLPILPLALCLPLVSGAGPAPHPGAPVSLRIDVEPDHLLLEVAGEQQVLMPWLGRGDQVFEPLSEADRGDLLARARRVFAAGMSLEIDGAPAQFELTEVGCPDYFLQAYGVPGLRFELRYPLVEPARRARLVWRLYEGLDRFQMIDPGTIALIVRDADGFEAFGLRASEPEYTWHGGPPRAEREIREVGVAAEGPGGWPLASLAVLALAGALAWTAHRRGAPRPVGFVVLVLGCAAAVLLVDVGRLAPGAVELPSAAEAELLFGELHQNIYAAFSSDDPDEIYDLLAVSVAHEALDGLFNDIYSGLILREEGGAICEVEAVEKLSGEVELLAQEASPAFDVDWSWQVRGRVVHYGHQHRRLLNYRARYRVGHDGRSWKIGDVKILDHQRLDPDAPPEESDAEGD